MAGGTHTLIADSAVDPHSTPLGPGSKVREPLASRTTYGYDASQDVCPWNIRFAKELPNESPYAPREALGTKDARTLAREVLAMDVEDYRGALKGSPMKRAKLPAMKRNAAVVLGNVGTAEDAPALEQALDDAEPLVREHAAWALDRITEQQHTSVSRTPAPSRNSGTSSHASC